MTLLDQRGLLFVVALLCGCDRPKPPQRQSTPTPVDSLVDSVRARILADTNSDASRETNLMSAPIDTLPLTAWRGDTIRWTAPADSCVLLILSRQTATATVRSDDSFIVGEWFGTTGFGNVVDIAPAPDWRWMAYGRLQRVVTDADADSLAAMVHASRSDVLSSAVSQPDGTRLVVIPVIERLVDGCSGDACDLEAASPALGGWRVGWTSGGDALVAGQEMPPHWVTLDPETRQPVKREAREPLPVRWISRSLTQVAAARAPVRSPSGAYAFVSENDSIVVTGPDRQGRVVTRFVGLGTPVTSTRNGQYLLAVRRTDRGLEAIVYAFRLHHAMMSSSCDR
jgi:hypothetical protein